MTFSFGSFDPKVALKKLRGKRLLFVGDSLQRNQWESFVCMVEWVIPYQQKSMKIDGIHPVFTAKVCIIYVCTACINVVQEYINNFDP